MPAILVMAEGPRLPQGLALLRALARHHPDLPASLVLADRRPARLPPDLPPSRLVAAEELPIEGLRRFAFALNPAAFSRLVLAAALRHTLEAAGRAGVVVLDADSDLRGPLTPLLEALRGGADAVLLPRAASGTAEREQQWLREGLYDPGCFALAASPPGRRIAAWWQETTRAEDEEGPLALGGRWLDMVPAFAGRTVVLRHPGLGVTPGNARQRASEAPLLARFPAGELAEGDSGGALLAAWKERLALAAQDLPAVPCAFGLTEEGQPIPPLLRRFYAEELARLEGEDPRPRAAWFAAPATGLALESGERFTRFAQFLHDNSALGQAPLDLRQPAARRHVVGWMRDGGLEALGFSRPLAALALAPLSDQAPPPLAAATAEPAEESPPLAYSPLLRASAGERLVGLVWRARGLYRLVPARLRRPLRRLLLRATGTETSLLVGNAPAPAPAPAPQARRLDPALSPGAVLLGYPEAELGVGQALRGLARGMQEAAVPLRLGNFASHIVAHEQRDRSLSHLIDNTATARAQIFCINADQLPAGLSELGPQRVAGAYNISYPFWELARLPAVWRPNFAAIDEVWAPSRFIQQALEAGLSKPVVHIGVGVQLPAPAPLARRDFGIPEGRYTFLFFFDYTSYASRKNPEGVIEAFRRAFPPDRPAPVTLVLKAMGQDIQSGRRAQVAALAAEDPRIRLIDRVLTPAEQAALLATADALVSLHRSEGFGLGMAEALLLGTPVVATGYGGCMDFLSRENACLVDHALVPVGAGEYPHGEGQVWAEPDLDQAAHYLRRLVAEPAWGRALAQRGQRDVLAGNSPAAVGRRAAQRLRALGLLG